MPFYFLFRDFFKFNDFILVIDPRTIRILFNSLLQAFLSSIISFLIALIPAFYLSRKNNILSKLIENTYFIPFFFPPVAMIISFGIIFSNTGLLSHIGIKPNIMYNLSGIIIAHAFYNSPIFVKYIGDGLKSLPQNISESAKIDGYTSAGILFRIELPLILPSVFRSFFLVFTYCFTSFAVVLSLGNLKYSTFEVEISTNLRTSLDFSKALVYALIQYLFLTAINLIISKAEVYELNQKQEIKDKNSIISSMIGILYVIFEYSLILTGIICCFFNFYEMKIDMTGLLHLFSESFNQSYPVKNALINSLLISFISGIISTLFAYFLLKASTKYNSTIIISTLGISGAFLGTALLYLNIIYNVPYIFLLILGYFLITIPIGYSFLFNHVKGFEQAVIEAAKMDGANKLKLFLKIEFPILFPFMLSSFLQVFAIIFGEFTISYTMQIESYFPLLSIVNYSMASSRMFKESSALSGVSIIIIFAVFYLAKLIEKKYTEK